MLICISNPKQPSCKKSVRPSKRLWWKKMWNPRWRPRNGCDGRLMVKILITIIQVNFGAAWSIGTKFTWIVVIKIFTINLPSQPFLGRHLGFHIFFHHSLFEGRTLFFTAWLFWIRFHFFLYLYTPKPAYGLLWDFFNLSFFLYHRKKKRWSRCTLNISDLISKCTNYIYNTYIYYRTVHGGFCVTEHSSRQLLLADLSTGWFVCSWTINKVTSSSCSLYRVIYL